MNEYFEQLVVYTVHTFTQIVCFVVN